MKLSFSITLGLLVLGAVSLSRPTYATVPPNLILNNSFEDARDSYDFNDGFFTYLNAPGWSVNGNVLFSGGEGRSDGDIAAVFNKYNTPDGNSIFQTFFTTVGQHYHVTYDYGAYGDANTQNLNATAVGNSLLGGKSVSVLATGHGPGADPGVVFQAYSFDFIADSTTTTLTFDDKGSSSFSEDGILDNVAVRPVPEASTVVLFVLTLLGGGLFLRGRGHKATEA
jgi:hypothetical protein